MRGLVCYPMKSIARIFVPEEYEYICAENIDEFSGYFLEYQPDFCLVFSEAFSNPVWEWLPIVLSRLPIDVPNFIIPLNRDQKMIEEIIQIKGLSHLYMLPSGLSHLSIKDELRLLLKSSEDVAARENHTVEKGKIYTMMSSGGAGVTTFCLNYPQWLAKKNPEVSIGVLDMNNAKPDISDFFSLKSKNLARFRPDLSGASPILGRDWLVAFQKVSSLNNLYYSNATSKWKNHEVITLLNTLQITFDVLFIDFGNPLLQLELSKQISKQSDYVYIFSRPDMFSLQYVKKILDEIDITNLSVGLVASPYSEAEMSKAHMKNLVHIPVEATITRIEASRIHQSSMSRSVMINELFPPKAYIQSLNSFPMPIVCTKDRGIAK
ncbi:hypothetical protein EEL32_16100 [Brevibacillus laterosporus]|nr:hypothetical protein [Brevibacillus laterosporus]TPG84286.1 hypothetical protein EEL32_16100 [Brevibacillus laterosporus]